MAEQPEQESFDNRGHKLGREELPWQRVSLTSSGRKKSRCPEEISEEHFEEYERGFSERVHYRQKVETSGLETEQVRLLYSYWGKFDEEGQEKLYELLGIPKRLLEAGNNLHVKHALAGTSLLVLSNTLMTMIEAFHREMVGMLQLLDQLDHMLCEMDKQDEEEKGKEKEKEKRESEKEMKREKDKDKDKEKDKDEEREKERDNDNNHDDNADNDNDGRVVLFKKELIDTIGLLRYHVERGEAFVEGVAASRAGMLRAIGYGQLIGRFLTKRYKRSQERKSEATPTDVVTLIV